MNNRRNRYIRPLITKIKPQPSAANPETKWDRRFKFLTRFELIIGLIAIPIIAIIGWNEIEAMAGQRRVNAWQLLTIKAPGNSGKISALEYLNQEHYCLPWTHLCLVQKETLTGIDLSVDGDRSGVYLGRINLSRANLFGADLSEANLFGADLRRANLDNANLSGALLVKADLSGADLDNVNLSGANLIYTDLSGSNLRSADLSGTDLRSADLSRVNLGEANLVKADLSGANLSEAELYRTDLSLADLDRASLDGADLSEAELSNANVSQDQLNTACQNPYDKGPTLPVGMVWHDRICNRYIENGELG